ncbi:MAG: hemerythrin domain-containing protein [Tatlockia sp.]|nr:hemerythrin domain-containing protein [Tatlockia sp.]
MNGIEFLISEHEHLRHSLMDITLDSQEDNKQKKFDFLCNELVRHEKMEHEVWYPLFQDKISEEVRHLISEEKHAENTIKQLNEIENRQEWEDKFSKFRQAVERHAKEEEDNLFPEVKKLLSESDLEQVGVKMYQFKKDHPIS